MTFSGKLVLENLTWPGCKINSQGEGSRKQGDQAGADRVLHGEGWGLQVRFPARGVRWGRKCATQEGTEWGSASGPQRKHRRQSRLCASRLSKEESGEARTEPPRPDAPPTRSPLGNQARTGECLEARPSSMQARPAPKPLCSEDGTSAPIAKPPAPSRRGWKAPSHRLTCSGRVLAGPRAPAAFNAPLSNFLRVLLGRYRLPIWANGGVQPGEEIKVAHTLCWNKPREGKDNFRGNYICLRVMLERGALATAS